MVKNITIKTIEGLQVKNLSRGYSMEWGEGGSMHCDIYWNDRKICEVTQEGNGGSAFEWYVNDITSEEKYSFKQSVLACLKRLDPFYGETSEYEWLRNKIASKIDGDDLEALEALLEERAEDVYEAEKAFEEHWTTLCIIDQDWKKSYLKCNLDTVEEVEAAIKANSPKLNYEKVILIKSNDNLYTL